MIAKSDLNFDERCSIEDMIEILQIVKAYLRSKGFKEIDDNIKSFGCDIDARYDRTLVYFDPANSIIVRIEASMGHERNNMDIMSDGGIFFNRIKLRIKGENQKLGFFKSELEKLIAAGYS